MTQRQGANATFGLCRLTRVIDNKRINNWQMACQHFWPAGGRKCNCFSRQPFQCAMCADMNHRICSNACLQPQIKRHITMTWHTANIMIVRIAVRFHTAFRLQGDQRLSDAHSRKNKHSILNQRVRVHITPDGLQITAQRCGQAQQSCLIVSNWPREFSRSQAVFQRHIKHAIKMT